MRTLATVIHGSHLFGTATETSDVDRKSVVVREPIDILLGRVNVSWIEGTKADQRARNTSEDEDHEFHDLLRYVNLLAQGQPVAIEMLFAPDRFHLVEPDPAWRLLRDNIDKVISKECGKFLGYCRRQAVAYSVKGDRLKSAELAAAAIDDLVDRHGTRERLEPHMEGLLNLFGDDEFVRTEERTFASGRVMQHLSVCDRLVAVTSSLGDAQRLIRGLVGEYGKRAQAAKASGGHDWKALSHAVRIGYEALELFGTGALTLPSVQAPHLLAIKRGLVSREEVTDEIGSLLSEVEKAAENSGLREQADMEFLTELVADVHFDVVTSRGLNLDHA